MMICLKFAMSRTSLTKFDLLMGIGRRKERVDLIWGLREQWAFGLIASELWEEFGGIDENFLTSDSIIEEIAKADFNFAYASFLGSLNGRILQDFTRYWIARGWLGSMTVGQVWSQASLLNHKGQWCGKFGTSYAVRRGLLNHKWGKNFDLCQWNCYRRCDIRRMLCVLIQSTRPVCFFNPIGIVGYFNFQIFKLRVKFRKSRNDLVW